MRPGTGVGGLCTRLGGRSNWGVRPGKFDTAARGVVRHIVHQLEKAGIIGAREKRKCVVACALVLSLCAARPLTPLPPRAICRGRFLTKAGQRELDTIAHQWKVQKSLDS
jgi:ribosomal protein S19E (S16A)